MAKLEFEYDETGDKFVYFILGFYSFLILPLTYFLWPDWRKLLKSSSRNDQGDEASFHPEDALLDYVPCKYKHSAIEHGRGRQTSVLWRTGAIVAAWLFLFWLLFKAGQIKEEAANATAAGIFNPYAILDVDSGADEATIKTAYRKLVLLHHPDKGGDENLFRQINKAYKTLTDQQTRENWETYGNPDGPGLMRFGIALPKWIIEGRNAAMLIAVYALIFIIGLPIAVGSWWYSSIKYTADKILVDTSHLYSMFLLKTPSMNVGRAIMVLSGSFEFERSHNKKIVERPSDNEELPALMRQLRNCNLNERTKERPLCYAYSVKARTLLYAYLQQTKLPSKLLEQDQQYMVAMCPTLLCEMAQTSLQLMALGRMGEIARAPSLETFEMLIRLSAMFVQALEERRSPLCQLPHVQQQLRRIPNVALKQLAQLDEKERRQTLKQLSDHEVDDVLKVLGSMPLVDVSVRFQVPDDDPLKREQITPDALVVATVTLRRKPLLVREGAAATTTLPSDYRVFCPFFPAVKYEQWWIYLVDRKHRELVASSKAPCSMRDAVHRLEENGRFVCSELTVELRFSAPDRPGLYMFQVSARSDSYLDLDASETVKLQVVELVETPAGAVLDGRAATESGSESTRDESDEEESSDDEVKKEEDEEYMTESE